MDVDLIEAGESYTVVPEGSAQVGPFVGVLNWRGDGGDFETGWTIVETNSLRDGQSVTLKRSQISRVGSPSDQEPVG